MGKVLVELLYGKHAHSDSRICVNVSGDVAVKMPDGFSHSIRQLVWHMNYWMEYELKRIDGHPAPYPEHASLSWPAVEAIPQNEWQQEVALFGQLLDRLAGHAMSSAETLARPIAPNHGSETEHASSLEAVLWQTLVHNSYHLGQVVVLRQAIGAWPPATGSDTW
jgi:uncharacterized damage-inducible protein DinB